MNLSTDYLTSPLWDFFVDFMPFFPVCDNTSVGLFVVEMERLTFNIMVWMNGHAEREANAEVRGLLLSKSV